MAHAVSAKFEDGDAQWQHMDARIARHLRELFDSLPVLAGFRLRSDLMIADVRVDGCPNLMQIRRLQVSVMRVFVELAECDPEAIALMRGRTFARHTL